MSIKFNQMKVEVKEIEESARIEIAEIGCIVENEAMPGYYYVATLKKDGATHYMVSKESIYDYIFGWGDEEPELIESYWSIQEFVKEASRFKWFFRHETKVLEQDIEYLSCQ